MAGIYLHIPFCKSRCIYCDFYSTTSEELKERYVNALCLELEQRKEYNGNEKIETLYFGGGTPSQLNNENFQRIFETIEKIYGLDSCKEITLEANPDDLSLEYLNQLSSFPFNRISLGCQTFDDKLLKILNRRHSARQAIEAIENCKKTGITNISIDLMYGLPGETTAQWEKDIQQAIQLQIPHISAYHLIYEEGTPLWRMRENQQLNEIAEEKSLAFFSTLIKKLTQAGYEHYEISNFCFPGFYSKHNTSYWTGKKYLGCGVSAHSFNGNSRQWNLLSLQNYVEKVESGDTYYEKEELDLYTRYNELIITSLRTQWGLHLPQLQDSLGKELYEYCLSQAKRHLRNEKMKIDNNILYITPEGIFISDAIMSDLLWVTE